MVTWRRPIGSGIARIKSANGKKSWKSSSVVQSKTLNNLLADTTMPPSQLLTALEHVWSTLADVPHKAIAGGLAVSFWGYPRSTRDVDLAILLPKVNPLQQLDQSLRSGGLRPKNTGGPKTLGEMQVYQWKYEILEAHIEVDVDLLLGDSSYFSQALTRSRPCSIASVNANMQVLSCEDLILFKAVAGRLIDLADIRELLAVNRESLDFIYLQHWSKQLGVQIPAEK